MNKNFNIQLFAENLNTTGTDQKLRKVPQRESEPDGKK